MNFIIVVDDFCKKGGKEILIAFDSLHQRHKKKLFEKLRNNKFFHIENKFVDQIKLDKKYDLIILDNVLEHIEEPNKVLKKIKIILNENGIIYIAVPNILEYKKNFRDPFGHTINYYENNIKYLFNSNGFKIIEFKKHFNVILLDLRGHGKSKYHLKNVFEKKYRLDYFSTLVFRAL